MLKIAVHQVELQFTTGGRLLPWLGPALRGIVAMELKNMACQWPEPIRSIDWKYCRGCPHITTCAYGVIYEADPPRDRLVLTRERDGERAVAVAPGFPAPENSHRGMKLPVRMTLIGAPAVERLPALIRAVRQVGQNAGLGPNGAKFEVIEGIDVLNGSLNRLEFSPNDLIAPQLRQSETVPEVLVDLASPLFLRQELERGKKWRIVERPRFSDLFRASLRIVGRTFAVFGDGPLENRVDFFELKSLAESVSTIHEGWTPFSQGHASRRSAQRWKLRGVTGLGVFGPVPAAMIPWLVWGGRLGVGMHRVAGAGVWNVRFA